MRAGRNNESVARCAGATRGSDSPIRLEEPAQTAEVGRQGPASHSGSNWRRSPTRVVRRVNDGRVAPRDSITACESCYDVRRSMRP